MARRMAARPWLGVLTVVLAVLAGFAAAQSLPELDPDQPVALIADEVIYNDATKEITAIGNVEVYYEDRTLTADKIVYNDITERISAEGEIVLRDNTGTTIFADTADLDSELQDGIVRGAKAVLGRFTRLSAVEAQRVDDRYNVLSKAAYSPCEVCEENPTPLWRIRARRVIHDQEKRIVHYESARLEFFGIPVAWTPYFSHPDPTVDRATGFLAPEVKSSSENYGYGVKTPFYIVVDDHTDLTLTPFVTTNDGVLGELELRRAFRNGDINFEGSLGQNDFTGETELHGHIFSTGLFRQSSGLRWGWDVNLTSDDGYLRYFDFSEEDRLTSELFADVYKRNWFVDVSAVRFQSLRDNEPAGQIPLVLPDVSGRYELAAPGVGGTIGGFFSAQGLFRNNGVDTGRISFGADWEREEILPFGLVIRGFAEARGDVFFIGDDPDEADETEFRLYPLAGVEARYPFVSEGTGSLTHLIEPTAQAVISPFGGNDDDIPNEDSLITEFDELNLFDESRFSGLDRVEEGPRFNLGVRYGMLSDIGLALDTTVGRSLRLEDADEFSVGSGLRNAESDWVGSWSASYDPYVTIRQRLRLSDDALAITRNEVGVDLRYEFAVLSAEYIFLEEDPDVEATRDREEITARARVFVTDEWSVNGFLRRDLDISEFVFLGGGVRFKNECCAVTASLRRDFTDSENVAASTTFAIKLELFTLGGDDGTFTDG